MSPQSSGFRGADDLRPPDTPHWPGDDWPGVDHRLGPQTGIPVGGGPGRPRGSGVRPFSLFLVAVVVCAVSVAVTLWVTNGLTPAASTVSGGLPSAPLPQGGAPSGSLPTLVPTPEQRPGGGNQPLPGGNGQRVPLPGGNGGQLPLPGGGGNSGAPGIGAPDPIETLMVGRVHAVTSNSVTIVDATHTITATVTGATRFSGRAHSLSAIKVGDTVAAKVTKRGGKQVLIVIQDPASTPGSLP